MAERELSQKWSEQSHLVRALRHFLEMPGKGGGSGALEGSLQFRDMGHFLTKGAEGGRVSREVDIGRALPNASNVAVAEDCEHSAKEGDDAVVLRPSTLERKPERYHTRASAVVRRTVSRLAMLGFSVGVIVSRIWLVTQHGGLRYALHAKV